MTRTRWPGRFGVAALLLAAFAAGLLLRGGSESPRAGHGDRPHAEHATTWTCSMHPQVQLPEAGACPICGMDLIPLEMPTSGEEGPRTLTLSASAQALAEIRTSVVERRAVERSVRVAGKLEADETRTRQISAWVPGRIDRLHIDYTGVPVRRGQPLFDLYSPVLYAAQEELRQAIAASSTLGQSSLESTRRSAARTVTAAREKLRLLGLTAEQIVAIEAQEEPSEQLTIVSPMSGVVLHKSATEGLYVDTGEPVYEIADLSMLWLELDVYEKDLVWVALGQRVTFRTEAHPGEAFEGALAFVDPTLDDRARSVRVRVNVGNEEGRLKPGMFARAVIHADVRGEDGEPPLVIPSSAPLLTGTRAVVYVADETSPGTFHGREVVLGPEADDHFVVREGLEIGERVVSNGSFKIDSALQILAKESMMNPGGDAGVSGHPDGAPSVDPIADVPAALHDAIDDVLAVYFDMGDALSLDDVETARTAAGQLSAVLDATDPEGLPERARESWSAASEALALAAEAIRGAADLGAARDAFQRLSNAAIRLVRTLGAGGRTPVLVYHCPMAMQGSGADWLQRREGTENPYYGSQMFRCGAQTEVLVAAPGPDTDPGEDAAHGDHRGHDGH